MVAQKPTGIVYSDDYLLHETGDHVENKIRLRETWKLLNQNNIFDTDKVIHIPPTPTSIEEIKRVHTSYYIEHIKEICSQGGGWLDGDTIVSEKSFDIALLAAGGAINAGDKVITNEISNAFCLIRPPGHHAREGAARGFCIFNNIAILARSLRARYDNIERVLILDHDAHAGNGTSYTFYSGPDASKILVFGFHQIPLYPGTCYLDEIGEGEGEGYNFNITMIPGSGDAQYLAVMDEIFFPVVKQFNPDIILISAGFDAHFSDPLTDLNLTTQGFGNIIQKTKIAAEEVCNGRIIILLEGGYNLSAISRGILQEISVLAELGIDLKENPPKINSEIKNYEKKLISQIKDMFGAYWKL
ncbi:MAG: histone deacetylase [Candidatus Helarchaeota archaeon]|nr:histone deacetylase [Candidatus Helarchaeota archaeon]